ncbi:DNA helicase UvrD [Sphingopyxis sp. Root1497]|uniref:ATP-dependent helicase n=1 Tax=Sphingopyxis sp. Root1497 TaxID=1736474 RepID=UPI0006F9D7E5|nr:ATP-dependent DNA helicase [Sphingopyxis sp. Root1497]KQZ64889.1 DNA helicase UvrD [Sphingopyxis sp. Root1497]
MAAPNPDQQTAIDAIEGPVLIIAGPGSGKTFTLVERIVHLIRDWGARPETLLVVTFTDKAARELTTRVSNRLLELGISFNLNEMYLGTFHSICLRLLKDNREFTRLKRNFVLLDQFDQQYFLYQRLNRFAEIDDIELVIGKDTAGRWYRATQLMKWVNKVAEEALDVGALIAGDDPAIVALGNASALYRDMLVEQNSLDFAGIQSDALRLLENNPSVLAELRQRLSHIMVDEYQDTNTIQERLLFLLAGEQQNICVVGDDDQGLYRFRGATIRNILEFPDSFATGRCRQERLTVNYRSTPEIISFYNRWIAEEDWRDGEKFFRFDKTIVPREANFPDTPSVLRISQGAHGDFHEEVCAFLHRLRDNGLTDWNQVAFLFRSVKSDKVLSLARHLEEQGIPVYSPRSNLFFDREEVRLMIGALIFLFPQFPNIRQTREGMELAIWEYYDHSCFKAFAEELRKPENASLLAFVRPLAKRHLAMTAPADYGLTGLFYQLLQYPLFSRFLDEDVMKGVDKGRASRNLALLSQLLTKFEYLHFITVLNPEYIERDLLSLFNQFLRFLYDGGIDEYEDDSEYAPSGCVSFLTIHQSKGLEFPVVVCGSLEAVPRKQWNEIDVAMEAYLAKPPFEPLDRTKSFDFRRLFYTAFSRAQNLLVLATQEKEGHGRSPSKYFAEVWNSLPNWRDPTFRPDRIDFDQVKEINLKRQYSFTSHIALFETCAEQYRFFRELEFTPVRASAQLFGTLVHQTIEDVHKAVLRGEPQIVTSRKVEEWFETNYHYLSRRERQYLNALAKGAALRHVQRYVQRERRNFDRLKEAEVDISLVKDSYILSGSVDLIRGEGDTVELIDFKAEKKPDLVRDRERLQQYRKQLEVYAHLVEERTGYRVSRTHLYYTGEESGNPFISWDKDSKAIDRTMADFDGIVGRIESRDYRMKSRPGKKCEDCDMRFYCDMKNWKFLEG